MVCQIRDQVVSERSQRWIVPSVFELIGVVLHVVEFPLPTLVLDAGNRTTAYPVLRKELLDPSRNLAFLPP